MSVYFLDTSAIVKRYANEAGHAWVLALCDPTNAHDLYISQAALVEVVAALCAKERQGAITTADRDDLIDVFRQDCQHDYLIRTVTEAIYLAAGDLCKRHKLRAYDAVQLACALAVWQDALSSRTSVPIFVCADHDLLAAARAEQMSIENPASYP